MNRIIRDGNIIDRMMDEMGYKRGTREGEECLDELMNRAYFIYWRWDDICERYGISSVDLGYNFYLSRFLYFSLKLLFIKFFISFLFLSEERRKKRKQRKKKETGANIPRKSSRNTLRVLGFWDIFSS